MDGAREILQQLLRADTSARAKIVDLAWTLAPDAPDAAFVCIDTAVDAELAAGNFVDAAALLQEFVTRVSGQIAALLKLVEICVDGGLEATMYEAQAVLADAYLESGQAAEARVIAEDLVAREPWEHAHIDRFRRALVLLGVPDPDALIADRLSGQGPFVATDPFMSTDQLGWPDEPGVIPGAGTTGTANAAPVVGSPQQAQATSPVAPAGAAPAAAAAAADFSGGATAPPVAGGGATAPPVAAATVPGGQPTPRPGAAPPRVVGSEPDIPLRPRVPVAPPETVKPPTASIDLSDAFADLQSGPGAGKAAQPSTNLEDAFGDFRSAVSRQSRIARSGRAADARQDLPGNGDGGGSRRRAHRSGAGADVSLRSRLAARAPLSEEG